MYSGQVLTQLAVLVARIARQDCPDHWPDLLPLLTKVTIYACVCVLMEDLHSMVGCMVTLSHTHTHTHIQGVQSSNPQLRRCSLHTLKHVIKCLSTRRLAPQRRAFFEVTMSLFVYLAKLWTSFLQESLRQLSSVEGVQSALAPLEMSRTCLKSRCLLYPQVVLRGVYGQGC